MARHFAAADRRAWRSCRRGYSGCSPGCAPPRVPGVVHLRARAEGLHHRAGAHDHRRASLPKLFGVEGGDGNFFERLWDLIGNLGDTQRLDAARWESVSLAIVLGLRRLAAARPGSAGRGSGRHRRGAAARPRHQGRGGRRATIQPGLPSAGPARISAGPITASLSASAVGILLVGFAEGLGAAKAYALHGALRRSTPTASSSGSGAANLGSGLCVGHGGERLACPRPRSTVPPAPGHSCRGCVVAALTVITLLFLTGLFENLPEATLAAVVIAAVVELVDIGALRRLYAVWTRPGSARSTGRQPARTSPPRSRPCSVCSSSTPCPGCSSASLCRSCCWSIGRRVRTWPSCSGPPTMGRVKGSGSMPSVTPGPRRSRVWWRSGSSPACFSSTPTSYGKGFKTSSPHRPGR